MKPSELAARLRARLRGVLRRDAVAGEIREELEFHVRMRAEDYERAGAPAPVAIEQAKRRFGNVALWQDHGYDVRGGGFMETIVQDLKYAVRLLVRQPGFSLVAILTLAIGIGLTTAITSVIDAALLHPLPYARPEELVQLTMAVPRPDRTAPSRYGISALDVQTIRATPNAPVDVAQWDTSDPMIADGAEPQRLRGNEIDGHYLGLFGVVPLRGRGIQDADTRPDAPRVVVIGYGLWQSRFGARDDAIGQQMRLDNESYEIVGVLPRGYYRTTALWLPLKVSPAMFTRRGAGTVTYARLRTGVTIDQASRELTSLLAGVQDDREPRVPGTYAYVETLLARETRGYWTTGNILLGSAGLILLIACVNVAGLLLARGATRLHEVAIRASIGAGRWRLTRQLLTESLVLAAAGAALGLLLAWWTLDSLVANIPLPVSTNAPATLNARVLGFSVALTLVTGLLFGLVPALRLSRVRVSGALARGSRRTGGALSRRGGNWLIGVEVALALVLVTGAALMIKSFDRMTSVDLGFQPESFTTLQASPADFNPAVFGEYYNGLVNTIREWPDVEAVGAANHIPLMGSFSYGRITLDSGQTTNVTIRKVLPGYFEALGLSPVSGRFPTPADATSGRRVAVINQRAAKQLFPIGGSTGRVITLGKEAVEVIGVVADLRNLGGNDLTMPSSMRETLEVFAPYQPAATERPEPMVVVVRPRTNAAGLTERLTEAARNAGARAIVERVRTGADWLDATVVTPRRRTVLLSLLGGLGLLLTLIGVFGMTAYAVARRTQEIGVRMAFGASASHVVRQMVREAARPLALGIAVGLAGAWAATRIISTFLFETTPTDPSAFAAAASVLAFAALVAVWIPARRAARVDPVTSLRTE
ncbi:MAG TPA: ABC transporter permease [Vicinamibacterales bacterium]|nr:ABC transporter permease [Vicinamibacterales bacterium]